MELVRGDYVSCVWVCEGPDALWSITILKRLQAELWETFLTWDKKNEQGRVSCRTGIHRILADGRLSEELVIARIEQVVSTIEAHKQCSRIVFIEIKAAVPETIIDRLYEAAVADDRLGFFVVVRDQPPQG